MRARELKNTDGAHYGWEFMCPGCKQMHPLKGWTFNGDRDRPTFHPSVAVSESRRYAEDGKTVVLRPRCHSWVKDGQIKFLLDSAHALAGQTVDLPEIPT